MISTRLKYVMRLGYGDALPAESNGSDGVPVFGSNGPYATTDQPNAQGPTIIVGRKGRYGKINWSDRPCFASDTTFFIDRSLSPHNLRWLFYAFHPLNLDRGSGEAAVPGINREAIYEKRVLVPDGKQQIRIANFLDAETAEIDALIAEKKRMLTLSEEKRAAIVTHAGTRGLDPNTPLKSSGLEWMEEIPQHWSMSRLKFLAEVRTGLTIGKDYGNRSVEEYYYLRVANVQDGYLSLESLTTVAVPESEAMSCLLEAGDVLMNEGGDIDKLGRGCVWGGEVSPCLHQNLVFCVRPHAIDPNWLATFTATTPAKLYFESRAKRTTNLPSISSSNIKELTIPLPPAHEQKQIIKYLMSSNARIDEVQKSTKNALELLKERRSALITAAVTGQIPMEEMRV